GDYQNYMPEVHLTSLPIDCSGLYKVHLKFWRWLGVESPVFDHAYVRVSVDGSNWTTVWENTEEIADNSWVEMDIDIRDIADDQPTVYLRWTMGPTDAGGTYCGWNIDDIRITAYESSAICGDCNGDGEVGPGDIVYLINYLYRSGPPPACAPMTACGDVNSDGQVGPGDIVYLINYLYRNGPPPGSR
ncbi:MAG: hypothetical protein GTO24_27035, partial [candidate division Zixibacteria bacterium]|nr:hypothetical protein [candidate division Zixibacteria bacterium]